MRLKKAGRGGVRKTEKIQGGVKKTKKYGGGGGLEDDKIQGVGV